MSDNWKKALEKQTEQLKDFFFLKEKIKDLLGISKLEKEVFELKNRLNVKDIPW